MKEVLETEKETLRLKEGISEEEFVEARRKIKSIMNNEFAEKKMKEAAMKKYEKSYVSDGEF